MSDRIDALLPLGGLLELRPGATREVTSRPQEWEFWTLALIGNQSHPNSFLLMNLHLGTTCVPLSQEAHESGAQTPIPMEKFPDLAKQLAGRSLPPGIFATAVLKNTGPMPIRVILSFFGQFEAE